MTPETHTETDFGFCLWEKYIYFCFEARIYFIALTMFDINFICFGMD